MVNTKTEMSVYYPSSLKPKTWSSNRKRGLTHLVNIEKIRTLWSIGVIPLESREHVRLALPQLPTYAPISRRKITGPRADAADCLRVNFLS